MAQYYGEFEDSKAISFRFVLISTLQPIQTFFILSVSSTERGFQGPIQGLPQLSVE